MGKRRSFDELEDERVFLRAVDSSNVRVVERREHLRFAAKPREPLRVRREILGQHFDGDVSAELGVAGAVDLTLYACESLKGDESACLKEGRLAATVSTASSRALCARLLDVSPSWT